MTRNLYTVFIGLFFFAVTDLIAQEDMLALFGKDEKQTTEYTYATFKTSRVVYGQSVENPASGNMLFLVQHNFGAINSGAYELFGLDQANIRLGFEYGINDLFSVGIGRSTYEKTIDGFVKAKILRQSTGAQNMPLTVSYVGSMVVKSLKWENTTRNNYFSSRLAYVHQILIARKFSNAFSFQLTPTLIHKNLVATTDDKNTSFACGFGGRYKLTQRTSLNAEYFYYPDNQTTMDRTDVISVGFDIETGGHVFQLHISNADAMFDRAFISETTGSWGKGDIYFGFNISRAFVIRKPKEFRK
jgi:opacity protein-like surface antigen